MNKYYYLKLLNEEVLWSFLGIPNRFISKEDAAEAALSLLHDYPTTQIEILECVGIAKKPKPYVEWTSDQGQDRMAK